MDEFFKSWPLIFLHPNPIQNHEIIMKNRIDKLCLPYAESPWEMREANMYKHSNRVLSIITDAMKTFVRNTYGNNPKSLRSEFRHFCYDCDMHFYSNRQIDDNIFLSYVSKHERMARRNFDDVNSSTALINDGWNSFEEMYDLSYDNQRNSSNTLPIIPDAVIHFRCNDILSHKKSFSNYGFLNFNVYPLLLPTQMKNIYILTDVSVDQAPHHPCLFLADGLKRYLYQHYVNRTKMNSG
jgi:hypothetical protein